MNRLALGLSVSLLVLCNSVAHANIITYASTLSGANEVLPNASPATGHTTVVINDVTNMMTVSASFANLMGPTTASHIHCCTSIPFTGGASVATSLPTFPNFPIGVTTGNYTEIFDLMNLATYNPGFVNNNGGSAESARLALLAGLASGRAYLNIHTQAFVSGEISAFFVQVPEPGSIALFTLGAASLAGLRRRRAYAPA